MEHHPGTHVGVPLGGVFDPIFTIPKKNQCPDAMEIYTEHVGIIDSFKCGSVKKAVAMLKEKIC